MKIIYIANARIPTDRAHGIQIMKMCQAFKQAGHSVELVVPWRKNPIKEDAFGYYAIAPDFKIRKLWSLDLIWLEIPRIFFWLQSWTFAVSVWFYCLFNKADIIYARDLSAVKYLSKNNIYYEAHRIGKRLWSRKLKKLQGIIAISQGLKDSFVDMELDESKVLVAHDGVSYAEFDIQVKKSEARKRLGLPTDAKIIMYIGLFDNWKGYETLLEASKSFGDERAQLVMMGGTKKQNDELQIKYPNVIFLDYQPYRNLPVNQKAADILVVPNSGKEKISRYWTSPLKVFAHMISGRPIVASDLPSLREVLNERTAVFFEPDDPEDLADKIDFVLKNPEFSARLAQQAKEYVKAYDWSKRADKIINFIRKYD